MAVSSLSLVSIPILAVVARGALPFLAILSSLPVLSLPADDNLSHLESDKTLLVSTASAVMTCCDAYAPSMAPICLALMGVGFGHSLKLFRLRAAVEASMYVRPGLQSKRRGCMSRAPVGWIEE
jgi:hypothetical protein